MSRIRIGVVFAAALALALPASVEAQGRGRADRERDREEREERARDRRDAQGGVWDVILGRRGDEDRRDDDRDRRDRDDEWEDRDDRRGSQARGARGNRGRAGGPPFCRNGEGHPVHGRQWCRDKGWGLGGGAGDILGDIILRDPRRERDRRLDRGGLGEVLGDIVLGRIEARGSRIGASGPLTGEWLSDGRRGQILRVHAGGLPIAELVDRDGDARVDVLRLRRSR